MPGRWDTSTKRLVGEKPEHFVRWLVKGAEFKGKAKLKPTSLNTREREVDNLYQIRLFDLYYLVHIEFQTYYDEMMAKRMWEYNILATFSYDCPTYSFVIYLKECEVPEPFYKWKDAEGKVIHHFNFRIIKLWETPLEELRQIGLV